MERSRLSALVGLAVLTVLLLVPPVGAVGRPATATPVAVPSIVPLADPARAGGSGAPAELGLPPTAGPAAQLLSGVVASPRPASHIDPTAGYSHEPAPMGIADFGLTGPAANARAYAYSTDAFEGQALVRSMSVAIAGGSTVMAFELNVVLVLRLGGANYTYWLQNGLHINATSELYTIGGAYVWNFSSPSARLTAGELKGNASSALATDTYYFIPGCGTFRGQCAPLTAPFTLTGRVVTGTSGGFPYVDYEYDLGAGWVTYDNVSFLHMAGATDEGLVVSGYAPTPLASTAFYDAEWVWVGAGGGTAATDRSSDLDMSLSFVNGENLQQVPNAWDFGTNTGEKSSNVTVTLGSAVPGGGPIAHLTSGPGSLGVLYNGSEVGYLNVSVPNAGPGTLLVDGVPVPFDGPGANLTLPAGAHTISLANYSNSSQPVTVTGGATSFVDLAGAGRVVFEAFGLPPSTPWSILIDGVRRSATGAMLSANLPNGSHSIGYPRPFPSGYVPNATVPRSLTVPVVGTIGVYWDPYLFTIEVDELGLPTGTFWWVRDGSWGRGGIDYAQSTGSSLTIAAPNGSTRFLVGTVYEFLPSPENGSIVVSSGIAQPLEVQFTYRPGYIDGTVSPATAAVTIGTNAVAITGGAFNASVRPGRYTLTASAIGYVTSSVTVNTTAGNVTEVNLSLIAQPSNGTPTASSPSSGPSEALLGVGIVAIVIAVAVGLLLRSRLGRRLR